MDTISYTQLREHLKTFMDKVCEDHEPLIVTRSKGENTVLMSLADYNAMQETHYILSNTANAAWLKQSIESANAGNTVRKDLIHPRA
jgi:antitoxin YefM